MNILKELKYEKVDIKIFSLEKNEKKIMIIPKVENLYLPNSECVTEYSLELIEKIIEVKTPPWVCNEIMREESSVYVLPIIKNGLLSYFKPEFFEQKSLLDFGCGCGASSIILKKLLPNTYIKGIDIVPEFIEVANKRKMFYNMSDIDFEISVNSKEIVDDGLSFDFIVLNGVFEHLLPDERRSLFIKIWDKLKIEGVLFINDTPYRYFPLEIHTTKLPFVNYLPDSIAYRYVKYFSKKISSDDTWDSLLRAGIRGGSTREITKILSNIDKMCLIMNPRYLNNKDKVDIWFNSYKDFSYSTQKKFVYFFAKFFYLISRITVVPYMSLALKKIK